MKKMIAFCCAALLGAGLLMPTAAVQAETDDEAAAVTQQTHVRRDVFGDTETDPEPEETSADASGTAYETDVFGEIITETAPGPETEPESALSGDTSSPEDEHGQPLTELPPDAGGRPSGGLLRSVLLFLIGALCGGGAALCLAVLRMRSLLQTQAGSGIDAQLVKRAADCAEAAKEAAEAAGSAKERTDLTDAELRTLTENCRRLSEVLTELEHSRSAGQ